MPRRKKICPDFNRGRWSHFQNRHKELDDFGQMDIDKKTIYIRKGMSNEENFDTLMHECVHACLAVGGVSYIIEEDKIEEGVTRCLDHLMFPIYKREIKKL